MECARPKYISKQDIIVPCGSCAFCTATRRSDWALRLHYESKLHLDQKFITLTYANPHLKWSNGLSQLCKKDLQDWFKRVRKLGHKIRYYAVGEYGSRTFRPHYHVLLFGRVPEADIRKTWTFGEVHIGNISQKSIMYCLGYIVNGKNWKMVTNRVKPFALMSRKPGLGANYLSPQMVEWHKSDRKNYAVLDGVKRHLPRYYKGKIFSKIDHVRIAVRDQKLAFLRDVKWLRSEKIARMPDPLAYRAEQRRRLAQKIKAKSKENLTI